MAKFKVGDKARIIAASDMDRPDWIGIEVTIIGPREDPVGRDPACYKVYGERLPLLHPERVPRVAEHHLAPLTPPAVDAWASEQVKKWTKPEPVTTRETRPAMSSES